METDIKEMMRGSGKFIIISLLAKLATTCFLILFKMGTKCLVKYCENLFEIDKHVSFHQIPSDNERRKKWLEILKTNACLVDGFKITTKTRICGDHFSIEDYRTGCKVKQLHPRAVPRVCKSTTESAPIKKRKIEV